MPVALGFTLQPDEEFLERCRPLLDVVDYAEVAPETLWRVAKDGSIVDNGYCGAIKDIVDTAGVFAVSHGVGFSLGSLDHDDGDDPRTALWTSRLTATHQRFSFAWMSDHSGLTTTAGLHLALPVPVPPTARRARAMAKKLGALHAICGGPGLVETSALPFLCGSPEAETALLRRAVKSEHAGLLVDVHNLWTMAKNLGGGDTDGWLDRFLAGLPTHKVKEIHVSGGSWSDPGWLPGGHVVRLDSHDDDVPKEVFALFARLAPRCENLRGVTLERMEGTVTDDAAVARLADELATLRHLLHLPPDSDSDDDDIDNADVDDDLSDDSADIDDAAWAQAFFARDPVAAVAALGVDVASVGQQGGVRTAALLVAKLRFERLLNASTDVAADFDDDPAAFAERFRTYHHEVKPTGWHPGAELALWQAWHK